MPHLLDGNTRGCGYDNTAWLTHVPRLTDIPKARTFNPEHGPRRLTTDDNGIFRLVIEDTSRDLEAMPTFIGNDLVVVVRNDLLAVLVPRHLGVRPRQLALQHDRLSFHGLRLLQQFRETDVWL